MLNCFYAYSFVWIVILVLYSLGYSDMNTPLNPELLFFILSTVVISFIIGFINRKKFKYYFEAVDYGIKPVIFISLGFILNFIYARSIPFFDILLGRANYSEFEGIPLLYVLIVGISFYFAINYFNTYLNNDNNKKKNITSFLVIVLFYLLCFSRSMVLFSLVGAFILYIERKKNLNLSNNNFKKVSILTIALFIFIVLFLFGGLGNVRSGQKFNDNTYIERIGLYNNTYPSFIPKQLMWTYSYLTSPLSNMNYNYYYYKNNSLNFEGVLSELLNRTISKRLFPEYTGDLKSEEFGFQLKYLYFNASSGYCLIYRFGGLFGMYIGFFLLEIVSIIQVSLLKYNRNKGKANGTFIILLIINTLMFFYNTLNSTTMSWWWMINLIALLINIKIVWRKNVRKIKN